MLDSSAHTQNAVVLLNGIENEKRQYVKTLSPQRPWKSGGAALRGIEAERAKYGGYTLAELHEVAMNPELWARLHGRIPDRVTKDPVPFVPSPLQRRMFGYYRFCQSAEKPCRMVVPKIRRGGGSTGAAAILYLHAHNHQARLGAVGTDETVSMNMFEVMRFFDKWDDFPGWKKASKFLETGWCEWPNGSSWEKYTAENPEAARSAGLQGYHATEVGRWQNGGAKDAKETLRSMLGAVPRRGFTVAIEESTAQGAQGAFYDRFQSARWPTAEELGCKEGQEYWHRWAEETPQNIAGTESERALQFVRTFAAWFEDDENRPEHGCQAEERLKIEATLDEKEWALITRYRTIGPQGERLGDAVVKATLWEQLAWRRSVIATEFEGDVDAFAQENPSSPADAFMSSGRHSFNVAGCAWMMERAKTSRPTYGILTRQNDGGVVFSPRPIGEAWMCHWQEPREGYRYNAGLDTCSGKAFQKSSADADYNAGVVVRDAHRTEDNVRIPHTVVASLMHKNQAEPDVLAEQMSLLCDWYGRCQLTFEVNNTGQAVRMFAIKSGMNLFRERSINTHNSEATEIVGWTTTVKTRPMMIGTMKKHLRNNANSETRPDGVDCPVQFIAEECRDMILHPDGKDAAPGNRHDDGVMALALALQTMDGATYYAPRRRKRREPADRHRWVRAR